MRLSFGGTKVWGLVVVALAACAAPAEEDGASTTSGVTAVAFDRNNVLDDAALLDPNAFDQAAVQKLFDDTPWHTRSVLSRYEEGGRSAAQILVEAARAHGINPLALVVRLQMEQSLVYKTTAPASTLEIAFGCGCPHSPVCSDKYMGFANQAECAAGTLRRSYDSASTETGTASGWHVGVSKKTEDGLMVNPKNAATTALYTYTPWVGEAGGGKAGVGGASLHKQVWDRFADNLAYKPHSVAAAPVETPDEGDVDAGADATPSTPDPSEGDDGTPTTAPTPSTPDAGDAGAPSKEGNDDSAVLKNTTPPPTASIPPPRSGSTSSSSSSSGSSEPGDKTSPEDDGSSKPATSGGCSTTPGRTSSDSAILGLALAATLVLSRRRR